ncbi:NifB/NifX family molybdenum-iron cluster-binding protein [Desulforamulus ruminis]|uniref:Dinitrogenase iron-molybdenum cofactor biosynthesis protein n=1 Tax=Desulforamulus ruminis (strain ATCC 23193 / DSM 2154 / NCIMB 8452 / DL) TaxID=696281 RepID=F6DV99_DESRL|nr:NifB/NifX family molybdenum-iron cluster-binding protein [Desulforamulus ruminis]AEG60252.1 Dinitrogenase iron-molybdenum cofactor biosynthesis protein [Desulforamulus ruminis DSM 2154]
MKIAIPVSKKDLNSDVCQSFGRSPYFLVYNTETKESRYIDNGAAASQGGAGIKAAQNIVDSKADALLTPRCGENAAEVIRTAGIKLYKTASGSAVNNLNAFINGELLPLSEIHAGLHHHGNR